jgi:hypothetical protein
MRLQIRFRVVALCAVAVLVALTAPTLAQTEQEPSVGLRLVADGFTSPVALVEAPDGSGGASSWIRSGSSAS